MYVIWYISTCSLILFPLTSKCLNKMVVSESPLENSIPVYMSANMFEHKKTQKLHSKYLLLDAIDGAKVQIYSSACYLRHV